PGIRGCTSSPGPCPDAPRPPIGAVRRRPAAGADCRTPPVESKTTDRADGREVTGRMTEGAAAATVAERASTPWSAPGTTGVGEPRPAAGTTGSEGPGAPLHLPAVFQPAPLPRDGRFYFYDPEGDPPPGPGGGGAERVTELTVVRPHGTGVRRRTVPAVCLPLDEALPLLVRARHHPGAHPATACWGAAALHALRLTA